MALVPPTLHHAATTVTLLLHAPKVAHIPLVLESYSCQDWDIRLAVEKSQMDACRLACKSKCSCVLGGDPEYAHRDLIPHHADGKQGLLYAQSDMWFDARMHDKILKDGTHMMLPGGGDLPTMLSITENKIQGSCIDTDKLKDQDNPMDDPYIWWDHSRRMCKQALNSSTISGFGKCCYDWSDLVYLPAATHAEFKSLALNFSEVFHEVAIPTILHGIAHKGNGKTRVELLQCQGDSTSEVPWEKVGDRMCAYRVPLEEAKEARSHLACLKNNDLCARDAKACRADWNTTAPPSHKLELPDLEPSPAAEESDGPESPYPASYGYAKWRCADACDGVRCPDAKGWALEAALSFFPTECGCSCSFHGHVKRAKAAPCGNACPQNPVEGETLKAAKAAKAMMAHKAVKQLR